MKMKQGSGYYNFLCTNCEHRGVYFHNKSKCPMCSEKMTKGAIADDTPVTRDTPKAKVCMFPGCSDENIKGCSECRQQYCLLHFGHRPTICRGCENPLRFRLLELLLTVKGK